LFDGIFTITGQPLACRFGLFGSFYDTLRKKMHICAKPKAAGRSGAEPAVPSRRSLRRVMAADDVFFIGLALA
jgi:hypothetical protein